eukprot:2499073-Rhodomonas_salina.1
MRPCQRRQNSPDTMRMKPTSSTRYPLGTGAAEGRRARTPAFSSAAVTSRSKSSRVRPFPESDTFRTHQALRQYPSPKSHPFAPHTSVPFPEIDTFRTPCVSTFPPLSPPFAFHT